MKQSVNKPLIYIGISGLVFVILTVLMFVFSSISISEKGHYITILHTNDVHGRLEPFKYKDWIRPVGGLAKRAALIKKIEKANKNVITVDAGDFAQGTLFFNAFNGVPDVKLMEKSGYDYITLGNHEFDKGLAVTKKIVKNSKIPFVCANIEFKNDLELQKMVKPYLIRDYYGTKVAITGLITEKLEILVNNLKGVKVLDPVSKLQYVVKKVNSQADIIVVLSHMGVSDDIKLAEKVPEIDVIIGGHSHTLIKKPKLFNVNTDKTLVVQGGEFGARLGRLDLYVKDKKIKGYYYNLIPVSHDLESDVIIQKQINLLSKEIEKYKNKKIGELSSAIGDEDKSIRSSLLKAGSLVTEAIKYNFPKTDIILQNGGGIRLNRKINAGKITLADVFELYPFENTIIIAEVKGSDLKSVLETSSRKFPYENGGFLQSLGLEYTVDINKPHQVLSNDGKKILKQGERVSDVKINGKPIETDKYYRIAVNNYMFNGGNGYSQFKDAKNVLDTGVLVQDAIVRFFEKKSPVCLTVKDKIHFK